MQLKGSKRIHQEWVNLAVMVSDLGNIVANDQELTNEDIEKWLNKSQRVSQLLSGLVNFTQGYISAYIFQEIKAKENSFEEG